MWTLVVLCMVSTAVSDNVDQRQHSTFESAPTAQIQNILQTTPYGDVSLPELSKYIANTVVPVPNGSSPNVNNNAPENLAVAEAASYVLNLPSNLPSNGDLSTYSPILPASNKPLLLHTQNPGNGLPQSILAVPYIQPQKPVNCDSSEVVIKIWMILSNLLKNAAPVNTYLEQIKNALILIKKYLQDTNTGQNNELMWRLILLETELDKGKGPSFDFQRSFNVNQPTLPIHNENVPKLRLQYELPPNLSPKCQEAFMILIKWAQEAYGNLMRGQCGSGASDSSVGYQGNINTVPAPYNLGSNSYFQLPYAYQLLSQNPQNTASNSQTAGISYPTVNQQLHNSGTNTIFQLPISQPNQEQHNTPSNPFAQTPNSLFNPLASLLNQNPFQLSTSSVYQKSVQKNPVNYLFGKTKNLGNIGPSLIKPPQNRFQRDGPLNPSYQDATVNAGNFLNPQLLFQGNFATNLQHLQGKIFTENLQQLHNPVTHTSLSVIRPNNPTYDATAVSSAFNAVNVQSGQQLDAGSIQKIMHNIPATNGFYENIQKYLNSQFNHNNWNTPQQYGTYSKISYQNIPYANNINQPLTYTEDQNDPTRSNQYSFNQNIQNLYQSSSAQQPLPAIDWDGIANESKLNSGTTPTGEVELTYALKNPTPGLQPLYFVKYRLPYDVFMQNVRNLLSTRSGKADLAKDLVLKSNASEVPQDLASYPKEEVRDLVVREGDLIKARYIEGNRTNDEDSSAAHSINALLNKAINPGANVNSESDVTRTVAGDAVNPYENRVAPTGILQNPLNIYQYQQGQGLYQNVQPLQRSPNNLRIYYQRGLPHQIAGNRLVLPQTGVVNSYNSVNPSL